MDLALPHLRALGAVVRHGSFSRAAAELRLTQPAVSMQIRQLEERVGLPLLDRVGKRATPTEAGELLLAHAARAFQELEGGLERVSRLRGVVAGRLRIGTSASVSIYLLPPLLRRFRQRYPETEMVIVTGNAADIVRAIAANDLDVGVVSLPVRSRELSVSPFYRDELVAIAPPRSPWRTRRSATPRELAAEPLILFERGATLRRVIDAWFQRGGAPPSRVMEMGNTEAIKKLVHAGLGLSVTSWFAAKPEAMRRALVALPLVPALHRELGVVRRRGKAATPALEVFLAALDEMRTTLAKDRRPAR